MLQSVLVGLVVALCTAHVTWRLLLPAQWRQHIATRFQRCALPNSLAAGYESQVRAVHGCTCDGCGARDAVRVHIIQMPRAPRR